MVTQLGEKISPLSSAASRNDEIIIFICGMEGREKWQILHQFTFAYCMQQSLYSIILALTFPWSFVSDDKKEH